MQTGGGTEGEPSGAEVSMQNELTSGGERGEGGEGTLLWPSSSARVQVNTGGICYCFKRNSAGILFHANPGLL